MANTPDIQTGIQLVSRELPEPVARRGILEAQWMTLCNSLYPGANPKSVLMVWDYCSSRNLDPMKKPVHIVPMEIKVGDEYQWRDVVMPGIYEYRITAHRTGDYLGHEEPVYGPEKEAFGVSAPEWCQFTVFRWNHNARAKVPFTVKVFFAEVVATRKDRQTHKEAANKRWARAPIQMLTKCAEAAALREAFPEEIGGEPTMEEMEGRTIDVTATAPTEPVIPVLTMQRVPEPLRDNVERGFSILGMSEAQRLAKINEFMGRENMTADDAGQALLDWLRAEYEKRKATANPAPRQSNGKRQNAAQESTTPAAPGSGESVVAENHVDPSGGASDGRGGGPEVASPTPTHEPSAAQSKAVKSDEIRWGGVTF